MDHKAIIKEQHGEYRVEAWITPDQHLHVIATIVSQWGNTVIYRGASLAQAYDVVEERARALFDYEMSRRDARAGMARKQDAAAHYANLIREWIGPKCRVGIEFIKLKHAKLLADARNHRQHAGRVLR